MCGKMERNSIIIIGVLVVIIIILSGLCVSTFLGNQNHESIEINDLNIVRDQYGFFKIQGHITPLKNFDYLEARVVFYDNQSTVIGKSPLAWNMRDVNANEKVSVSDALGATCEGTPAYAVISFYDSVYSDDAIINFTVRFDSTGSNDDSSDDSSDTTSSDSSDSRSVYAYKSDGTPMYSKEETDNYMLKKYGTDDYERQSNGYIDPSSVGKD